MEKRVTMAIALGEKNKALSSTFGLSKRDIKMSFFLRV
jgi:hypothetical protein